MKIKKNTKRAAVAVKGQFVAIGSRGVVVTDLAAIAEPLKIGVQPILKKVRGENHAANELWNRSCSWITSSREEGATFELLPVAQAVKSKKTSVHKGLAFKGPRGQFTADVIAEAGWSPEQKQPAYLGVLKVTAGKFSHNRIESRLIREADGSESRNKDLVAKLVKQG